MRVHTLFVSPDYTELGWEDRVPLRLVSLNPQAAIASHDAKLEVEEPPVWGARGETLNMY